MRILIDNGHGENTPGKRSPDGKLREWEYTRRIADMVIMGDNLLKINEAFKIAKYTRKKVIQNIILSLTVKFIVMILAILLGFFVTKDGEKMELPLGIAIFSDVGISLLAILNSLLIMRLYHNKKDLKEEQTNAKR